MVSWAMFVCLSVHEICPLTGSLHTSELLWTVGTGYYMLSPPPPPPPPGSVGDYDPESHKKGYTEEFQDFILIPKSVQVCHHSNKERF